MKNAVEMLQEIHMLRRQVLTGRHRILPSPIKATVEHMTIGTRVHATINVHVDNRLRGYPCLPESALRTAIVCQMLHRT